MSEYRAHYVDLSHTIETDKITYPGLPTPVITPHLTREKSKSIYAPGTEFAMDIITMIGNTGTYLDSPYHRYADGADLAALDLRTLVNLRAEVFHLDDSIERGIPAEVFYDRNRRVLRSFYTGWDRFFGSAEYGITPFLTESGASYSTNRVQRELIRSILTTSVENTSSHSLCWQLDPCC